MSSEGLGKVSEVDRLKEWEDYTCGGIIDILNSKEKIMGFKMNKINISSVKNLLYYFY